MKYTQVADYDYLIRDNSTNAIINTDKTQFESAKNSRGLNTNIKKIYNDVETLKDELSVIKNLLRELIRNGNT
jgi:DNA-binding transcriptional regulator GbsR (MarR family)